MKELDVTAEKLLVSKMSSRFPAKGFFAVIATIEIPQTIIYMSLSYWKHSQRRGL